MAPDRVMMLLALTMTRPELAFRAMKTMVMESYRDHHPTRLKADRADPPPGQVKHERMRQ